PDEILGARAAALEHLGQRLLDALHEPAVDDPIEGVARLADADPLRDHAHRIAGLDGGGAEEDELGGVTRDVRERADRAVEAEASRTRGHEDQIALVAATVAALRDLQERRARGRDAVLPPAEHPEHGAVAA